VEIKTHQQNKFTQRFMMSAAVISVFFLVNFFIQDNDHKSMTADEFRQKMAADTNLVILDVRNPDELSGVLGRIDKAINIPVQDLEKRIAELTPYKSREIAVICRSGNRSHHATEILLKHQYKATNVAGGMLAFRKLK
jgi:rhodanese-related sulfurtransferase